MSNLTTGRAMVFERLLAEDAIMLPQYRKLGGRGIMLAKALNRPFEFERTDTAYSKTLDFLPSNWNGAVIEIVGGATIVDDGELISAGVTSIVSKDAEDATLATLPIPAAVQALPGYGWSAGSVYNEVDWENKKYIQRVASVDMGTLNWVYYTTSGHSAFRAGLSTAKRQPSNVIANIICPAYTPALSTTLAEDIVSLSTASSGNDNVYVIDSDYTDADTFKAAMSGVMLYYELATQNETDISSLLSDDNLIEVEPGGTLTFENQLGDGYRIPVPTKVKYQRRVNNS